MSAENPAHEYREMAKQVVAKLKENLVNVLETGKSPDLYWKLEQQIVDAMRYADGVGAARVQKQVGKLVANFEADDGSPSQ